MPDKYISYKRPSVGESRQTLAVPENGGAYEMRLYSKYPDKSGAAMIKSVPFTVQ
ncbi:MAG: hypothetical protein LBD04_00660 [Synergistaceae bacterium]|nr:hypothetical protein [Synergistaceae bacterium]